MELEIWTELEIQIRVGATRKQSTAMCKVGRETLSQRKRTATVDEEKTMETASIPNTQALLLATPLERCSAPRMIWKDVFTVPNFQGTPSPCPSPKKHQGQWQIKAGLLSCWRDSNNTLTFLGKAQWQRSQTPSRWNGQETQLSAPPQ